MIFLARTAAPPSVRLEVRVSALQGNSWSVGSPLVRSLPGMDVCQKRKRDRESEEGRGGELSSPRDPRALLRIMACIIESNAYY